MVETMNQTEEKKKMEYLETSDSCKEIIIKYVVLNELLKKQKNYG